LSDSNSCQFAERGLWPAEAFLGERFVSIHQTSDSSLNRKAIPFLTIAFLVILIAWIAAKSKPVPAALGPPQVTFLGCTVKPDGARAALFTVANTNASSIAFRIFGPQTRSQDGEWPNVAAGFGKLQNVPPGSTAHVEVAAPTDVAATWRIRVGYERGRTAWERVAMRLRLFESKFGLPQFPAPPDEEDIHPPVVLEVSGAK
jgi:hypothetical protein